MPHTSHYLTVFLVLVLPAFGFAQDFEDDKVLSPYFYIPGNTERLDLLPVKSIAAQVQIAGVIADVRLSQTFVNQGALPIEAVYVFPAFTKAAVYGLTMKIGEREIVAKIEEKESAHGKYTKAKNEGFRASLLEQHRPNVFQMNVANIMPGDTIIVNLNYTELIESTNGNYAFVFPTVVGPRYSERSEATGDRRHQWVSNPYLEEGHSASYSFDLDVHLNSPVPIKNVRSTSHDTEITFLSAKSCDISINTAAHNVSSKDFVLNYSLVGDAIQSGILINKGAKENFFALLLQPPAHVQSYEMPSREYTFVVDVSGSMAGFPLNTAKEIMNKLLGSLTERDRFNVVLFASESNKLFKSPEAATPANIREAIHLLSRSRGGGGTRLYSALHEAIMNPSENEYSRTVVVITDGYIDAEEDMFDLIQDNLDDINVFSFGVGTSVNHFLIEGMAKSGKGVPFVVGSEYEAKEKVNEFINYVGNPVLTNIRLDFGDNDVYDVSPGKIPDVFKDRSILVYGKFRGEFKGNVTLTGNYGLGTLTSTISLDSTSVDQTDALPYLWVRKRIEELETDKSRIAKKNEITQLGLDYSLMTTYTSFLAIDTDTLQRQKRLTTVKQPIPLPTGVSASAIGNYRQNMNATGGISRGTSGDITLMMFGESTEVANSIFALRWEKAQNIVTYDVVIKNLMDKVIWRQQVQGTSIWIDLSLPEFANDQYGLFILEVSGGGLSSLPIGIKRMNVAAIPLINMEQLMPWEYFAQLAEAYEKGGLLLDAMTAYEIGIHNYPDNDQLMERYKAFLIENGNY